MDMSVLIALPVIIPLIFGALSLVVLNNHGAQRLLGITGATAVLAAAIMLLWQTSIHGIKVLEVGSWPAPFGIVLVSDLLGAIMVLLAAITGFATAIYSLKTVRKRFERFGYYPLLHLLLAGVNGAFLTGDIFNLYVWFEVLLVASFALLIQGGERAQMEGAIKYVTLNLLSSALFLTAIGLLYGLVGSLNMADIAVRLTEVDDPKMVTLVAMLFLIAFSIKAAAFPLFFWLPASYHTPQVAVSAIFAGLLTKVGVYALYRVFTLMFTGEVGFTHQILLWMAVFTMLTGVLGAASQYEVRRILSFHIISQIGYMMLALALFTPLALIGGVFYIMHHIIVKANLFFVAGMMYRLGGSFELKELGGLYKKHPGLAVLFLIPAFSLAGVPPLSGFFAKFILIKASVEAGAWWAVAVALFVGLFTLFSMIKIWNEAFWKKAPQPEIEIPAPLRNTALYWTTGTLAAITIAIGIFAQPIYVLAEMAANQLLNPQLYIDAVLGGGKS